MRKYKRVLIKILMVFLIRSIDKYVLVWYNKYDNKGGCIYGLPIDVMFTLDDKEG